MAARDKKRDADEAGDARDAATSAEEAVQNTDELLGGEELAALREEAVKASEYRDLAQRTAAELANLQKRMVREKDLARKLAVRDTVLALLPSLDNLERTMTAGGQDPAVIVEGARMVHGQIHRVLEELGLEVIAPEGGPLDPMVHDAVFRQETAEVPEGHVIEVFEKGYRLGDLILRPARVTVAAAPAPAEEGSTGTGEETDQDV